MTTGGGGGSSSSSRDNEHQFDLICEIICDRCQENILLHSRIKEIEYTYIDCVSLQRIIKRLDPMYIILIPSG